MHLYMVLKNEKKIGFNGGIGAWGWSVSGGKGASEWEWNPRSAEPCVENVCWAGYWGFAQAKEKAADWVLLKVGEEGVQGGNCSVVEVAKGANLNCL